MNQNPFSITVFAVTGDSQGIRQVDKSNWSGKGIVFRRDLYDALRGQPGFEKPGVYVLVGYGTEDTVYIGEADPVGERLKSHIGGPKDWDWGVYFFDTLGRVGKTEVQFLEAELVQLARRCDRAHIVNKTVPTQPTMSDVSKATAQAFLQDILLVLPLLGVSAFTEPRPGEEVETEVVVPVEGKSADEEFDTIVVPAREEGFQKVFIGENAWHEIRINHRNIDKIKYVAVYRVSPMSAITHIAEVANIVPYKSTNKWQLNFKSPAVSIGPIPRTEDGTVSMQSAHYALRERLLKAKTLDEVWK